MKFSILALAAASLISAQNLSGEPACATPCLVSAISAAGCAPTDVACQCGSGQNAIAAAVGPCLINGCTVGSDFNVAVSVGLGLCSKYSASLNATTTSSSSPTPFSSGSNATTSGPTATSISTTSYSNSTITSQKPISTIPPSTSKTSSSTSSVSAGGAAQGLVAGIGGVVGLAIGVVAAL